MVTTTKKALSIDEQIAKEEAKLLKLKALKEKEEQKAQERNEKAIMSLLRENRLLEVPAKLYGDRLPELRRALGLAEPDRQGRKAGASADSTPGAESAGVQAEASANLLAPVT